jgi:sugar lactone lactonase YvrE
MHFDVIASGLGFPEGPVVMEDGSIILVEIQHKCVTRLWNGKREVIATLGGAGLLGALRGIARGRGWETIRWITADDNHRARTLYDKHATRTWWVTYDMAAGAP